MNKTLLLLSLLGASFTLKAQDNVLDCSNGRYTDNVFESVTKTTDIIFGYNTTTDYSTQTTHDQTLKLDFYEPAGDPVEKRPLIILMFPGAFVQGQRSDLDQFCIALARKGYATATIDYRLVFNSPENQSIVFNNPIFLADEVIKASADLKAAIRFFKHDAATSNTYKIDPTKIVVGGGSAGAIAALHTAYTDDEAEFPLGALLYAPNGGFEGNTDFPAPNNLLPTYNASGIVAVLNIAGGIADTNLIDAHNPPVYSSQGDADEVVPYNFGVISYGGLNSTASLFGSHLIQTRANNIGLYNELYTIPGGGHESTLEPQHTFKIISDASAFLTPIVCGTLMPVTLTSFSVQSNNCLAVLRWQTATEKQSSHYDIESSADGVHFTKAAVVNSKNAGTGADYTFSVNGYTQPTWFRLKMVDQDGGFTFSSVQKFNPTCVASVQIYPNPAQAQATVSGLQRGMQVQMIDAAGRLLWSQKATNNTLHIPLTSFAKGLLMVQVKDTNGKVLTNSKLIRN